MGERGPVKKLMALTGTVCATVLAGTATGSVQANGDRAHPYALHTSVVIPSSHGWKLRVNKSVPNATQLVLRTNMFNDKPARGRQFFMINLTLTYVGRGSSSAFEGLSFKALGRSNVAYDVSDSCGVTPNELDDFKKVYTGGSMSGNVCFSVKGTDAASLLLLVEPGTSFDDVERFFRVR
jgi:hypothetical protein